MDRKFIEMGKRTKFSCETEMIFKKMYCCKCGKKLSIKFVSLEYRPDEKWGASFDSSTEFSIIYSKYFSKGSEYFEGVYVCKNCNYIISCAVQKNIRKYQDAAHNRVLNDNIINSYNLLPKDENFETHKGEKL